MIDDISPPFRYNFLRKVIYLSYRDYQNARDAAWQILLDCGIDRLPVSLNIVCRELKIKVLTYEKGARIIQRTKLDQAAHRTDGMTFYMQNVPVVLYDEKTLPQRAKFTVAHEVGHIIMGHVKPGYFTVANREPQPGDAPEEQAANQFAARLLAPACVLWGMGVHSAEEIMELCRISKSAAEFRAHRMAELYRRNQFLTSPLERKVYRQFQPFIREYQNSHQGE